jgi:hypothetical protein
MSLALYMACMGDNRKSYIVLEGKPGGGDYLEDRRPFWKCGNWT